ncbi:MAG TPA: arsenate reductase ArsC [Alphaproteobacteria bacterium]|nr:arsenate reductase ArsC [Alphaproteobacteria bacterium]
MTRVYNVLFLCSGNSARSIMAESLLTHWGKGRFRAFSAGSAPRGSVHPMTIEMLQSAKLPTAGLHSKDWHEFTDHGAPVMDFVFTVCDQVAAEPCPAWPGAPMTAHWGVHDPLATEGSEAERRRAFYAAFRALETRIKLFVSLPVDKLDGLALKRKMDEIGRARADAPAASAS